MSTDFEIRPITDDEVPAFRAALFLGFGADYSSDGDDRFRRLCDLSRTVAVFDGDQIVGTLGDYELSLTVPGGAQVPMAGTTLVSVRSTHRRSGILRLMMQHHLDAAVARSEPIAGLWASEAPIYGRFGFGLASEAHSVSFGPGAFDLRTEAASDVELRMIEPSDVPDAVGPLWSQLAAERSGFIERTPTQWSVAVEDPAYAREGASERRHVVARRNGQVTGYLTYRQREKWDGFVADGSVSIELLVASDHQAHRTLWSYVTSIDLFPRITHWNVAIDDPIVHDLTNERVMKRQLMDALYVRILDVEAALTARTYECDDTITIAVVDDLSYAAGTFELEVAGGSAAVTTTTKAADVTLGVRELGAIYLGGRSAIAMHRAGLIDASRAAAARLDRLFRTAELPWCPNEF